jgi:DNA-binding MarR family transcriptional regulator
MLWNMFRSFGWVRPEAGLIAISIKDYIVINMNPPTKAQLRARSAAAEQVAEHLLPSAARLVRLLVRQVRSTEISRTEMEVLTTLRQGPRTIGELTELEGTAQPTMTVLVKRLEAKGWVGRSGLQGDGRVVVVSLTDDGVVAQQHFRQLFVAALRVDLEELSDEQLEALAAATETLSEFVDELQQRTAR